jgi:hypothetical protein
MNKPAQAVSLLPDLSGFSNKELERYRVLSEKIHVAAAVAKFGRDAIMLVYLAGVYHGGEAQARIAERANPEPQG